MFSWRILKFSADEEHIKEAYFYDLNSLIGEVGGSLGLFLGLSLLATFDAIAINLGICWKRIYRSQETTPVITTNIINK